MPFLSALDGGFCLGSASGLGAKLSTRPDVLHLPQDASLTWLPLATTESGISFCEAGTILEMSRKCTELF